MKKIITIVLFSVCLIIVGCDRATSSINATSDNTLYRSMTGIKQALPEDKRLPFEVSFWSLKRKSSSKQEFRDLVGGKDAEELVALAKESFAADKAADDPTVANYESWDAMIEKLTAERESYKK